MSVRYNEAGQSRPRPSQPSNKPSKLLSHGENETLFAIMGHSKQSMASAVVQILGTRAPDHRSWDMLHCGVATFTKDNGRRSYFIELYDIEKNQLVFEEELYNQFVYHAEQDLFHQFEGEHQMIGINFADRTEAESFKQAIEARLKAKQKKKNERMQHKPQRHTGPQQPTQSQQQPLQSQPSKKKKKKKDKKGKKTLGLSAIDISTPTNFQHISHVGFDPNQDDSEVLKGFFDIVGLKEEQLQDPNTRKFVLDFINENGGIQKAMEETELYGTMPASKQKIEHQVDGAAGFPPGPPRSAHPPTRSPAPPGQKIGTGSIKGRPQPSRGGKPQVPLTSKPNQFRGPHSPSVPPPSVPPPRILCPPPVKEGPPPPPSGSGGPPPPPPPPPSSAGPPPPPAPSSKPHPGGNMSSPKNDFLSQISAGGNHLKKAEPVQRQVSSGDARGNLLDEIQRGKQLKKVDRQDSRKPEPLEAGGLAGALAMALNARNQHIQHSDDDSDDDEDSDVDSEEWDE